MGDDEPTLLTGSPTRSYDSDGSVGPALEEIPLVGRRRLPSLNNNPEQKATHYWVRHIQISEVFCIFFAKEIKRHS